MASEDTVRVELHDDEQYPWPVVAEPGKWPGTDLDRPWVEVPEAVVARYEAACNEWDESASALYAAADKGRRGGVPALAAHIAKDPDGYYGEMAEREARDLDPKDRPRVVAELVRRHKAGETATLQAVLIDLGIVKGPGPEWDDRG